MQIGIDRICDASDYSVIFAMQIGVTRIGSGGRCMPRSRKGAFANVRNLVASETEEIGETLLKTVKPITKACPVARMIVTLALWVITLPRKMFSWVACMAKTVELSKLVANVGFNVLVWVFPYAMLVWKLTHE